MTAQPVALLDRASAYLCEQWCDNGTADALIRDLCAALEAAQADAAVYRAMLDACEKLPQWWDISFTVEKDSGYIHLSDCDGNSISVDMFGSVDSSLAEQVAEALAFALEHDIPDDAALTTTQQGHGT